MNKKNLVVLSGSGISAESGMSTFRGGNGLWDNVPFEPWTGLNDHCEQRLWGSEIACFCLCAGREIRNMDAFEAQALSLHPAYQPETGVLSAGDYQLTYVPGRDDTQYL